MQVDLMWVTPDPERQIAKMARVSSSNPDKAEYEKLFRYCLRNGHWSIFQMSSLCVYVETSLAISTQMMRHWSLAIHEPLDVQQLSQRYTDPLERGLGMQPIELRKAAATNRQSSSEPLEGKEGEKARKLRDDFLAEFEYTRRSLKALGTADECLRFFYPQATTTRFYVSGSCRSWIHYFQQRDSEHAQLEHQEVAVALRSIFAECFPTIDKIVREQAAETARIAELEAQVFELQETLLSFQAVQELDKRV